MKRGTEMVVKFAKLQHALGLRRWQTKGILQSIWDFTAENAILGNLGRFRDEDIALGIDYDGDSGKLIGALVSTGWLDRHPRHRLVVHDWHEHCEEWVKKRVQRSGFSFASDIGGQRPPPADNGGLPSHNHNHNQSLAQPQPSLGPTKAAAAEKDKLCASLQERGLTPAKAKHWSAVTPPEDLVTILAFYDEFVSTGVARTPVATLKHLLTDPGEWGFTRDPNGRLMPPPKSLSSNRSRKATESDAERIQRLKERAKRGK